MSARAKPAVSPEAILADHTPPVREIAERLRELVRATVPEAIEKAYPGWHAIGYTHPKAGYFGAIFPRVETAMFWFEWGSRLDDPHGVLRGTTKRGRYVEFDDIDAIPVDALIELLHAELRWQLEMKGSGGD